MPTALFLSSHLDDVAFSCGGTLLRLREAGWDVPLCTVFTATVPDPQGFALRCQTDKGLAPDVDYMALRRVEDRNFAALLGVPDVRHWPFPEAPHRGYESAEDLFRPRHAADDVWRPIAEALRDLAAEVRPDVVFAPQGLGGHVDHLQVIQAALEAGLAPRTYWYRDTPYTMRDPEVRPSALLPDGLKERAVLLTEDEVDRKIAGALTYASQIGFQFRGPEEAENKLRGFHALEGQRAGYEGFAERFRAAPALPTLEGFSN